MTLILILLSVERFSYACVATVVVAAAVMMATVAAAAVMVATSMVDRFR